MSISKGYFSNKPRFSFGKTMILGLMMMIYDRKDNKHQKIIRFAFFWGTFSTLGAALTGTVLYLREGYGWEDVQGHLILGILTFVFSFLLYLQLKGVNPFKRLSPKFLGYGLVLILTVTGHLGGNLTHGKDHLTEPLPPELKTALCFEVTYNKFILFSLTQRRLEMTSLSLVDGLHLIRNLVIYFCY